MSGSGGGKPPMGLLEFLFGRSLRSEKMYHMDKLAKIRRNHTTSKERKMVNPSDYIDEEIDFDDKPADSESISYKTAVIKPGKINEKIEHMKAQDIPPNVAEELKRLHARLSELNTGTVHDDQRKWVTDKIDNIHKLLFAEPMIVRDL